MRLKFEFIQIDKLQKCVTLILGHQHMIVQSNFDNILTQAFTKVNWTQLRHDQVISFEPKSNAIYNSKSSQKTHVLTSIKLLELAGLKVSKYILNNQIKFYV